MYSNILAFLTSITLVVAYDNTYAYRGYPGLGPVYRPYVNNPVFNGLMDRQYFGYRRYPTTPFNVQSTQVVPQISTGYETPYVRYVKPTHVNRPDDDYFGDVGYFRYQYAPYAATADRTFVNPPVERLRHQPPVDYKYISGAYPFGYRTTQILGPFTYLVKTNKTPVVNHHVPLVSNTIPSLKYSTTPERSSVVSESTVLIENVDGGVQNVEYVKDVPVVYKYLPSAFKANKKAILGQPPVDYYRTVNKDDVTYDDVLRYHQRHRVQYPQFVTPNNEGVPFVVPDVNKRVATEQVVTFNNPSLATFGEPKVQTGVVPPVIDLLK